MYNEYGWEKIKSTRNRILGIQVVTDSYRVATKVFSDEDALKFKQETIPPLGFLLFALRREDCPDGYTKLIAVFKEVKGEVIPFSQLTGIQ